MHHRFPVVLAAVLSVALSGCVQRNVLDASLPEGDVVLDGRIVAIDTDPWAYDGNAVVQLAVPGHGMVPVHLPARWNLCAAPPVGIEAFRVGDEVQVTGAAGDGVVVVCEGATHGIASLD